jgi:hypothetical protein
MLLEAGMRRIGIWLLGISMLLSGCDSQDTGLVDTTPIAAKIATSAPGSRSILVPPTLSPAEKTNSPSASSGGSVDFTLSNQSGWRVCYVYIADPAETTWGDDWLGKDEEVGDGETRLFSVPSGTYDIRAESCDYIPLDEEYNISLKTNSDWTVKGPTILFEDYFNDSTALSTKGAGAVGSKSGNVYRLRASQKGVFALAAAGQAIKDGIATIEATPILPADTTQINYGLMCRLQPNGDGYAFVIRGDGYGSIQKIVSGKRTMLVDWTFSDELYTGSELNVIEAYCSAEQLNLRLNGVTELKTTDSTFTQGDIALAVMPLGESQADVEFDNLVVRMP